MDLNRWIKLPLNCFPSVDQVVVATVTCPMRFVNYPFDRHSCPFLFGSYTYDYNYITFQIDNTFLHRWGNWRLKRHQKHQSCLYFLHFCRVYQQNTNLDYDIEFNNATHQDSTFQDRRYVVFDRTLTHFLSFPHKILWNNKRINQLRTNNNIFPFQLIFVR